MTKPLSSSRITFSKLFTNYRASLIAQSVKNPPTMRETWVRSLGWEDPLEKGKATHSSILAWRIPWTIHGAADSDTTERLSLSLGAEKYQGVCVHGESRV